MRGTKTSAGFSWSFKPQTPATAFSGYASTEKGQGMSTEQPHLEPLVLLSSAGKMDRTTDKASPKALPSLWSLNRSTEGTYMIYKQDLSCDCCRSHGASLITKLMQFMETV
ncbi:unnamed protein product [Ophioblennius macclurei]